MLPRRPLLSAALFTAFTFAFGACALPIEGTSGDEELKSEPAMITLLQGSHDVVYANITSGATKALQSELLSAARRHVDVHVLLKEGSHDTTWTMQQSLESNGVDVDVVKTSPVATVAMVADGKALVGTKTVSSATSVANYKKKFAAAFAGTEPAKGSLLKSGVHVWAMPDASRDRIVQLFEAATISIDLSIYQLQERRVVQALEDAAGRGVKVRVMLEPKTVGGRNYDAISTELAAAKITVKPTPTQFDKSHNVDHAKFCIIDGKELLFGTGNMVRSGLGGVTDDVYANRDFWVEDTRATTRNEAQRLFDADFAQTSSTAFSVSDLVVTPDNADASILAMIDGAKTRLWVYNQSLNDADLVAALIAAHKRGVDVRVLLGYQPGFGHAPPNQKTIDQLGAAGIDAQYLKSHYLHAKAIVADTSVYLGSQNFTSGGLRNNREFGEVLTDSASIATVVKTFEADAN